MKLIRHDTPVEFVCARCKGQKKSKLTASRDGEKLCNGCYGYLLSRKKKPHRQYHEEDS